MHKTLRLVIVFACLVSTVGLGPVSARSKSVARGTTSAAVAAVAVQGPPPLVASPSQFYQFDAEEFISISGGALGDVATTVTYTNGNTVLSVDPQVNPTNPQLNFVWVPAEVTNTVGHWDVRVLASESDGSILTFGPAGLDIV